MKQFIYIYLIPSVIPSAILLECFRVYISNGNLTALDSLIALSIAIMFYALIHLVIKNEIRNNK